MKQKGAVYLVKERTEQRIQTNRTIVQILTLLGLILTVFLAWMIYRTGYEELLTRTRSFLEQSGGWGPLFFILIQISQVIYPILPGGITLIVGQLLFGPLWGFLYSFLGVTVGSILNFFLARRYGKPFVRSFVSEETYIKYYSWLTKGKRFDVLLGLAFFLPGFPDDFLCMLAGLTEMSFRHFLKIYLIFKPFTLFLYGAGGAGVLDWLFTRLLPLG